MTIPLSEIKQQFRAATRQLHKELDSLNELSVLKGKNLNSDTYALAMQSLYYPHCFLEQVTCNALKTVDISYPYTLRYTLLEEDLNGMGIEAIKLEAKLKAEIEASLLKASQSSQYTLPQIIGYLYLLEGSKMGSAHISQLITRKTNKDLPVSFFSSPLATDFSLNQFWNFAASNLNEQNALQHAIETAQSAFRFYIESIRTKNLTPELLS